METEKDLINRLAHKLAFINTIIAIISFTIGLLLGKYLIWFYDIHIKTIK